MIGMGLFPMIWGVVSDHYGRKWVLVSSLASFTAFSIGLCFAPDVNTLIILRTFQSIGIAATLPVRISAFHVCFIPFTSRCYPSILFPPPPGFLSTGTV